MSKEAEVQVEVPTPSAPQAAEANASRADPSNYPQALRRADAQVEAARQRIASGDLDWLPHADLANALLDRARLNGSLEDLVEAQEEFEAAFERAPEGGGPYLERAAFRLHVHELETARADIEASTAGVDRPGEAGRRARAWVGLHLQREDFGAAAKALAEAGPSDAPELVHERGLLAAARGELDQADAIFAAALDERAPRSKRVRAWLHLQRGLLDLEREDWPAARAHYREADFTFEGWWLVLEHEAEALAQNGELEEARALYETVVATVDRGPLWEALADVAAKQGDEGRAKEARAAAAAATRRWAAAFPESAKAHAHAKQAP